MKGLFYCSVLVWGWVALFGSVYEELSDVYNPTMEDYWHLQDYLHRGDRPYLERLSEFFDGKKDKRYIHRMRNFNLVRRGSEPVGGIDYMGNSENQRKMCIVSYASMNKNYPEKLRRLQKHLRKVDFGGHFLYQIGGWPNLSGGGLYMAHIPYAFKYCMIKEAMERGYENILWVDVAFIPMQNIDQLFDIISLDGFFAAHLWDSLYEYSNYNSLCALQVTIEEAKDIPNIVGGIFGVNNEHPIGSKIMAQWKHEMELEEACFSPRPEQGVLAAIFHRLGLSPQASVDELYATHAKHFEPGTLFFLLYSDSKRSLEKIGLPSL